MMHISDSHADLQSNSSQNDPRGYINRVSSIGRIRRENSQRVIKVLTIEHHPDRDDHFESPQKKDKPFDFSSWWKENGAMFLQRLLPCIGWIKSYNWRQDLKADIVAGVTVGTMLIPQSMSYAKLAGLHPIYGLYSGFIPVATYVLFGSSRQLAVGSVAMVSLLVSNGLLPIIDPQTSETEEAEKLYVELAIHLAFLVGVIECFMGLIRLGWLIRFISHSVVSGFTTASALIIGLSQAKNFLGYEVSNSPHIFAIMASIVNGFDKFKWQPFVMGSVTLALLLVMKHLGKSYKRFRHLRAAGPLSAVVLGVAFVKIFKPASISVVGTIPQGFPPISVASAFSFRHTWQLLPHAALVSGVAILESVGIAQALAAKNAYEIDSNQELFGLGIANLIGSTFSAYPVTGSFSRSAVSNDSGAKTGLFGVVVFLLVGAALLFLTPAFTDIPQCGLAAIVVSAVIGLVDYNEAIFLWRVDKRDLFLWTATFVFTLLYGIEFGVLIGVGLSLVFVIYESANPHTAILGRLPGTTVYRNTRQYPEAYTYNGIVVIRIDAPIYFANTSVIKDRLRCSENNVGTSRGIEVDRIQFVIFEMSPVTYVDSSAVHAIKELYHDYRARGIQLALCNPNWKVMITLARGGVPELIGHEWYFVRVHDAVQTCMSRLEPKSFTYDVENLQQPDSSSVQSSSQQSDSDDPLIRVPLLSKTRLADISRGH